MNITEKIQYPAPEQHYKVLVSCFTYNHSKYIEDALNGFAIQQTNFPFVCHIMDDASTDGTQDVIKKWMEKECDMDNAQRIDISTSDVVITHHKINKSCTFAFYLLKQNLYGTGDKKMNHVYPWREKCLYEATCEGDDYWIDPLKLQLQVDFLDSHPDYSFCCHRFNIYEQNTNRWLKEYAFNYYGDGRDLEITRDLYVSVWVTQPLTLMSRISARNEIRKDLRMYKSCRDVHLFYYLLKTGKGISLNRNMGVYRWHNGGIASNTSGEVRYKTAYNIYKELMMTTGDPIFRRSFVKNTIRLIRYKALSKESIEILKEVWSYSHGIKEKMNILVSFFTPLLVINLISSIYRSHYLSKQVI